MPALAMVQPLGVYPERRPDPQGHYATRLGPGPITRLAHRTDGTGGTTAAVIRAVRATASCKPSADASVAPQAARIARVMRGRQTAVEAAVAALALTRDVVEAHLGFRAHDEQIAGAWHMLCGRLIEMDTGEGKTVTAVFAAAAHALAGRSVHLVTVNDYLAERDAHDMRPVYAALGLTVGCVKQGMSDADRRSAYRASVVYVTPKQLMFDYLRDRIRLGACATSPLRTEIAVLRSARGAPEDGGYYLRGLQAAVVDEADSVLVDEAVVPLIISRQEVAPEQGRIAGDAIALARQLREGDDFGIAPQGRDLWLTDGGRQRLERLSRPVGNVFAAKVWREQYCEQALTALHLFRRDRDYIIRGDAIEIVDINTGRTMPDRSWERGLHQMIQAKEDLAITAPNESLARISHQAFFQRYLNLCGMSGTVREVAGEIRQVYGLSTVRIPPHRTSRRLCTGVAIVRAVPEKDRRVVARAAALAAAGRAVLIGTRTVADSERLSAQLAAAGIPHRVLNARHDEAEARIIAEAGTLGAITVATNMAGRGTDIRLDPEVRDNGGLHVIATERHGSRRIDRQLFGRTARQGDPGSYEEILCLEDEVVTKNVPARLVSVVGPFRGLRALVMGIAQRRASRAGRVLRSNLARYESHMDLALAFAGPQQQGAGSAPK